MVLTHSRCFVAYRCYYYYYPVGGERGGHPSLGLRVGDAGISRDEWGSFCTRAGGSKGDPKLSQVALEFGFYKGLRYRTSKGTF